MSCDCIERIGPLLEKENIKLGTVIDLQAGAMRVALMSTRLSKERQNAQVLQAAYCPFCGKAYGEGEVTP